VPANSYESLSSSLIVSAFAYEICCGQVNSMRTARCMMEMVLCRLPLASLLTTWCMCRRWRDLTIAPQFLRMRREKGPGCTPWLFLFEVDGNARWGTMPSPAVHALDVAGQQWCRVRWTSSTGGSCSPSPPWGIEVACERHGRRRRGPGRGRPKCWSVAVRGCARVVL
jgi:hypothetical protein